MPEGDSIRRVASRLQPLIGQTLARVTTQGIVRDLAGRTITAVAPHGKHLMIDLDDGTQLRMHLGMNGRVRYYMREDGEAAVARISPGRASLVLVTADYVAMWIQAPTVEITARRAPMRGVAVASLGPDVLADELDPDVVATRAMQHPHRMIGEVLLDQRVAAGIGNIWRCESLFVARLDPRALVGSLSHEQIAAAYRAARELMLANLRLTAPRAARDHFNVYSRTNKPCPRCGAAIRAYQLGEPPRWTWSCPVCQPSGASGGA
jgi:endonuclease-8